MQSRKQRGVKDGQKQEEVRKKRGGWGWERERSVKSEIENKMVRNGDGACAREGETEGKAGRKRREEVLVKGKCLLLCIQKDRFS